MSHYRMERGWLDHPVFAGEPFSRHAAWAWMIEQAAWKPRRVSVATKIIGVERGQFCHSLRHMAKAWKWDESKVRRFILRLVRENMIECVADSGQSVITICNYDKYQASECVGDADTAAATTQARRSDDAINKEVKEGKKETLRVSNAGARAAEFSEWWIRYPEKVGKGAAEKSYARARASASAEELLAGIDLYIRTKPPDRAWAHPTTWLNQRRWLDQPAAAVTVTNGAIVDWKKQREQEAEDALYRSLE